MPHELGSGGMGAAIARDGGEAAAPSGSKVMSSSVRVPPRVEPSAESSCRGRGRGWRVEVGARVEGGGWGWRWGGVGGGGWGVEGGGVEGGGWRVEGGGWRRRRGWG